MGYYYYPVIENVEEVEYTSFRKAYVSNNIFCKINAINLNPDSVNKRFYWCEINKKDIPVAAFGGKDPKELTIKQLKH